MRNIKIRQLAAQAILNGNNHRFAVTRDEGGELTHEILGPSFKSDDWRFNEAHDDNLAWGAQLLRDSNDVVACSLVRIMC